MKVLVFAEVRGGKLKSTALQILTEARKILGGNTANLHAVLMGEGSSAFAAELGRFGASHVYTVDTPETNTYQGEPHVQTVLQLVQQGGYNLVLAASSPMGRDFFPRAALRSGSAILTDLVGLKCEGETVVGVRPIYAGKALSEVVSKTPVTFATLRPNSFAAEALAGAAAPATTAFAPSFDSSRFKAKLVEVVKGKSEKPDLTEASVIISGGRAMGSADAFKILFETADVVGATVGASRAAVDTGYAPYEMQVGQTGKTVSPNLYIACGISGSIQHLAGMRTSKVIVAINTDADAPIFQKADYGIVADLFQAVPVLKDELKKLVEG